MADTIKQAGGGPFYGGPKAYRDTPGVPGLEGINGESRLYVIRQAGGFSCLGFDVAYERTRAVAEWLQRPALMPPKRRGTARAWRAYQAAMSAGAAHYAATGERCNAELSPQLVGLEGRRVQVIEADGERRRFYVGKSTGWFPVHLEIATRRSHGGFPTFLRPGARVGPVS